MKEKEYYIVNQYITHLSTLLITLLITISVSASEWNFKWITYPKADSVSQIQYRHTYVFDGCPKSGKISIASKGRHVLYVNGYNVSPNVMEPGVCPLGGVVTNITYDVTRYLKADSNIVAVWSSPIPPCSVDAQGLALSFWGKDAYGHSYSFQADEDWLCRLSGATTTSMGEETCDAQLIDEDWYSSDFVYPWWQGVEVFTSNEAIQITRNFKAFYQVPQEHTALRPIHIYNYKYFDDEGQHIIYRFPRSFNGWIRLTFRDMQPSSEVYVNGLRYVCNGMTDEQACRRFTTIWQNSAEIILPQGTKIDNIQNIEGIEMAPYLIEGWK